MSYDLDWLRNTGVEFYVYLNVLMTHKSLTFVHWGP